MKGFLIAGTALALAGAAHATDWQTSPKFGLHGVAFNLDSLKNNGATAEVWLFQYNPDKSRASTFTYALEHVTFLCGSQSYWADSQVFYGPDGEVKGSVNIPDPPKAVVPDSVGEGWYQVACKGDRRDFQPVGDDVAVVREKFGKFYKLQEADQLKQK